MQDEARAFRLLRTYAVSPRTSINVVSPRTDTNVVSPRTSTSEGTPSSDLKHTSGYVSIRQDTSADVVLIEELFRET